MSETFGETLMTTECGASGWSIVIIEHGLGVSKNEHALLSTSPITYSGYLPTILRAFLCVGETVLDILLSEK